MTTPTVAPRPGLEAISWWRRLAHLALGHWRRVPRPARQIGVAVLGTAVLIGGVAMIVLPGPAVLVVPLGLAILASEFPWARRLLDWSKVRLRRLEQAALARFRSRGRRGSQHIARLEGISKTREAGPAVTVG
jgi:uncharacterized protein (TIGR02611 family)